MSIEDFFVESSPQSRVKAEIVSKYFRAWANVILPAAARFWHEPVIAYRDLFSGPGAYEDGTESTPLLVLRQAVADPKLCEKLVTHFNDADGDKAMRLRTAIYRIPGIERLAHRPEVTSRKIDVDYAAELERTRLPPTLSFYDPFGYCGLSLRLLHASVKDRGCDCIFFFNYLRVNPGLSNELFAPSINPLFGAARASALRGKLVGLSPDEREDGIVSELVSALREECGRCVLAFPFSTDAGTRTSHYLMFVSKSHKGYDIMKNIMGPRSSSSSQGVPSFGYNTAEVSQPFLPGVDIEAPLVELEGDLLTRYAGQQMTFQQLYQSHSARTRYLARNYRDAIRRLEQEGRIQLRPAARERKMRNGQVTIPPDTQIVFPK